MTPIDEMDMTLCKIWRDLKEINAIAGLTNEMPEEAAGILREIECLAGSAAWKIEGDMGCKKAAAE